MMLCYEPLSCNMIRRFGCSGSLSARLKRYASYEFGKFTNLTLSKERREFARTILALRSRTVGPDNPVTDLYMEMHELSRHAIHMSETLQVAAKTVKSTLRYVDSHPLPDESKAGVANTIAGLQFSASFLANLKLRADAFVDRLENEIRLVSNFLSSLLDVGGS